MLVYKYNFKILISKKMNEIHLYVTWGTEYSYVPFVKKVSGETQIELSHAQSL